MLEFKSTPIVFDADLDIAIFTRTGGKANFACTGMHENVVDRLQNDALQGKHGSRIKRPNLRQLIDQPDQAHVAACQQPVDAVAQTTQNR